LKLYVYQSKMFQMTFKFIDVQIAIMVIFFKDRFWSKYDFIHSEIVIIWDNGIRLFICILLFSISFKDKQSFFYWILIMENFFFEIKIWNEGKEIIGKYRNIQYFSTFCYWMFVLFSFNITIIYLE
jgi:hypothetical protein